MKANITIKKIISVIPLFVMLFLIFSFSDQDGETSGGLSHELTIWLIKMYDGLFNQHLTIAEIERLTGFWEFYVRKAAHVSEYAVLTFTVFLPLTVLSTSYRANLATEASIFALSRVNKKSKYHIEGERHLSLRERLVLTVPATVLLAALDELHQYFIPGRCGTVTDIGIDSIGIIITTLLIILIHTIQSRSRARSIHSSSVRG